MARILGRPTRAQRRHLRYLAEKVGAPVPRPSTARAAERDISRLNRQMAAKKEAALTSAFARLLASARKTRKESTTR